MQHRKHLASSRAIEAKRFCCAVFRNRVWDKLPSLSDVKSFFDSPKPGKRTRFFPEWTTLLMFLEQVLGSDQSCRNAIIRARVKGSLNQIPSSNTAAYCKARARLREEQLQEAAEHVGQSIDEKSMKSWLWCGRSVKLVDGTTISMPDTEANQKAYPQNTAQKPGLGYPIARVLVVISLATGAIVRLAMGTYRTSEYTLLRSLLSSFSPGDVILADQFFDSYFELFYFSQIRIDAVIRLKTVRRIYSSRKSGVFNLEKPDHGPNWMSKKEFEELPDFLPIRVVWKNNLAILTTIIDEKKYSDRQILSLYKSRWNVEVDLRCIKSIMQMDILRCKTPEMVRKELWVHIIAYNLVRSIMVEVARRYHFLPRHISFKTTVQIFKCNTALLSYVLVEYRTSALRNNCATSRWPTTWEA